MPGESARIMESDFPGLGRTLPNIHWLTGKRVSDTPSFLPAGPLEAHFQKRKNCFATCPWYTGFTAEVCPNQRKTDRCPLQIPCLSRRTVGDFSSELSNPVGEWMVSEPGRRT